MEFDRAIKIQTKRLLDGATYRDIREELLERFCPEDAMQIATESYRAFRKESVKSSVKSIAIGILLLVTTYVIAPPNHAFKPRITIALWSFLILKTAYDWYQIRKSEKEFIETEPQF